MNDSSRLVDGEGNFWSRRSTRGKAIIGTGVLIFLAVVVLAIVLTVTHSGNKKSPTVVCTTDACHSTANTFLDNLKKEADPCDDFYNFACGRYAETHKLPEDRPSRGSFDDIAESVTQRIKGLFNSIDGKEEPSKFAKTFIDQCKDIATLNKNGKDELTKSVDKIGDWTDIESSHFWDNLITVIGRGIVNAVISISVQPDPFDPNTQVLTIDQPSFGISQEDLLGKDDGAKKNVEAYKKYLKETAKLLNRQKVIEQVDDIIAFETELAKIATPRTQRRDPFKITNKMEVDDLRMIVSNVDWDTLLQGVLKTAGVDKKIQKNTIVVVQDLPYIKKMGEVINTYLNTKESVTNNYLGWMLLQSIGWLSTDEFRNNELEFRKVTSGVKQARPQEDRCIDLITGVLPMLAGRLYVDKYFTNDDKEATTKVIDLVLSIFKELIPSHEWLDEATRKKALEKAEKITVNAAYPEWIKNNSELAKEYPLESFQGAAITHFKYMIKTLTRKNFDKMNTKTNWDREWPFGPAVVNAAYMPPQNSITFPAGILQGVFFNSSLPDYLNLGAIGVVAGHEISHGFDDEGSKYEYDGRLHDWWSRTSRANFATKAKCFEDQYGSINDTQTGMKLNGKLTLGENIADNGGIHQAFSVWKKVRSEKNNQQLLPGMEQFTTDQLFFFSHANVWCSISTDEYIRRRILTNPHSPARYRVNVPLMNSPDFQEAFKCKEGAKMNPKNKCSLW